MSHTNNGGRSESELTLITAEDMSTTDAFRVVDGDMSRRISGYEFIRWLQAEAPAILGAITIAPFIDAPDTPLAFAGSGGSFLRVNLAEDAVEFVPGAGFLTGITALPITDLLDVNSVMAPNDNDTLSWDGINNRWTSVPGLTSTFISLSDTPGLFAANRTVKVNSAGNALEFVTPTWIESSDTPVDYTGATAGDLVVVNGAADGLEFFTSVAPVVVNDYIHLQHMLPAFTAGQLIGNGGSTFFTVDLNTELSDDASLCALAASQFTLQPGTYRLRGDVDFQGTQDSSIVVYRAGVRLFNTTAGVVELNGQGAHTYQAIGPISTTLSVSGQIVIAVPTTFRLEVTTTFPDGALGRSTSTGGGHPNVYVDVVINRVLV